MLSPPDTIYGLIGNGRLSKHLQFYLKSLSLTFLLWNRSENTNPEHVLGSCDIILICISDDATQSFLEAHPKLAQKPCIHFSGAHHYDLAQGFHPLFNFTNQLYPELLYSKIPFVLEKGRYTFKDIFPTLQNPHYYIETKDRAKYHALCVMAGNFPTMLWSQTGKSFEAMGLPYDVFFPYIQNITDQFQNDPDNALTGPFTRGDIKTIKCHKEALHESKFESIYQAFEDVFLNKT